jgi:tRNA dimethylallyltransferase
VGGTGLYLEALTAGLDFGAAPPDPARRAERSALAATPAGQEQLRSELVGRDPAAGERVDLRNSRRLIRALELLDANGGSLATARGRGPGIPVHLLGLDLPREEHERRIRQRATAMFRERGLVEEVRAAKAAGISDAVLRASGIGYTEALLVVSAQLDEAGAIEQIVRRTLRYAKAQRTWWRRRPVEWLDPRGLDVGALAGRLAETTGRSGNKRLHTDPNPC